MKILILGGTGAIGTPLIAILRQNQDIQICVTSRSEHSSEENVQYLKADVLNQSELENILMRNHWDAVIDFMIYSESVFRQRIGLLLKSTDQYFFLSSATEYSDLDEIITEKTPRLLDVTTDKELLAVKPYPINKPNPIFDMQSVRNTDRSPPTTTVGYTACVIPQSKLLNTIAKAVFSFFIMEYITPRYKYSSENPMMIKSCINR